MLSAYLKKVPIPLMQLALLVLLAYLALFFTSALFGLLLVLAVIRLLRQLDDRGRVIIIIVAIGSCLIFFCQKSHHMNQSQNRVAQVTHLTPQMDTIQVSGDRVSFVAKDRGHRFQVFYRIKSPKEKEFFETAITPMQLEVISKATSPTPKRNFDGFDYAAYLSQMNIYQVVEIETIQAITKENTWHPLGIMAALRRSMLVYIHQRFPSPMKGYVSGLLFGETGSDFNEIRDSYSSLGIVHLFALSGLQVGFFIGMFREILLRLGMRRDRVDKTQMAASIFYAGLTGCSISVLRALTQHMLKAYGFRNRDSFAVTLLLAMFLMPYRLMSLGGELSFSFAFLLTCLTFPNIDRSRASRLKPYLVPVVAIPVVAFSLSEFQPVSIFLTVFFSWLFDWCLLPLVTVSFILSPVINPALFNPVFSALEKVVTGLQEWVGNPLILGKPGVLVLLIILLALIVWHDRLGAGKWGLAVFGCLCLAFS